MILITLIVVYIVDLSGWTEAWKPAAQAALLRLTGREFDRLRPFDCSRCLTFWACMAYALLTGTLTLQAAAVACLLSFFSDTIATVLRAVKEGVDRLLNHLLPCN